MDLEPKFSRPGKVGHVWPGVYKLPPSHPEKVNRWRLACPAPLCFLQGAYPDEGMAQKMQETHTCPWYGGGKTTLSWGIMSDMFLAPIWADLDGLMDVIKSEDYSDEERQRCKSAARGMAQALAHLMPPFFHTWEEVATEAQVRWQKRQAGEDYETPGIGRLRFKTPPGAELLTPSGIPHDVVVGTKSEPEHHPATMRKNFGLSEDKAAAIVSAVKAGFPARMLATAHGVSEQVIQSIAKANA